MPAGVAGGVVAEVAQHPPQPGGVAVDPAGRHRGGVDPQPGARPQPPGLVEYQVVEVDRTLPQGQGVLVGPGQQQQVLGQALEAESPRPARSPPARWWWSGRGGPGRPRRAGGWRRWGSAARGRRRRPAAAGGPGPARAGRACGSSCGRGVRSRRRPAGRGHAGAGRRPRSRRPRPGSPPPGPAPGRPRSRWSPPPPPAAAAGPTASSPLTAAVASATVSVDRTTTTVRRPSAVSAPRGDGQERAVLARPRARPVPRPRPSSPGRSRATGGRPPALGLAATTRPSSSSTWMSSSSASSTASGLRTGPVRGQHRGHVLAAQPGRGPHLPGSVSRSTATSTRAPTAMASPTTATAATVVRDPDRAQPRPAARRRVSRHRPPAGTRSRGPSGSRPARTAGRACCAGGARRPRRCWGRPRTRRPRRAGGSPASARPRPGGGAGTPAGPARGR